MNRSDLMIVACAIVCICFGFLFGFGSGLRYTASPTPSDPSHLVQDVDDLRAQERATRALIQAQRDEIQLFCIHLQSVLYANSTQHVDLLGDRSQTLFDAEMVETMCTSLEGMP